MLKGLVTYIFTDKMTADLLFHRISSGYYASLGPRPEKFLAWRTPGKKPLGPLDSVLKNPIPEKSIKNTARFIIKML